MNWSKLWYIATIFSIAGLLLITGYLIGNRTWEIQKPDIIAIKGSNNAQDNELSKSKFQNVKALVNGNTVVNVGVVIYRPSVDGKTEILVRINSLPINFGAGESLIPYPKDYTIFLAKETLDGLNYDLKEVGKLALDPPDKNQYTGTFFTILDFKNINLDSEEKLLFINNEVKQLPPFDNPGFVSEYRKKPAPFMWTE